MVAERRLDEWQLMPVREPARVYPHRIILTSGGLQAPWVGMRDARETTAQQINKVLAAINFYLAPGGGGRAYVGRPGITVMGEDDPATEVQAITTWYRPDGTGVTFRIADGAIDRFDWITDAWVPALTASQIGAASITLAASGRVQIVPFASGLVINDRVNPMFYWTGVDGTGMTELTNAPIARWVWVKSAKLVAINAASPIEIQWSEENQPNLGYAAGGYNNAWELRQLGNAPLVAGIGRNDGQILFRERSCFSILGEIGPDFRAASTNSDISERLGTTAPWSLYNVEAGVVFVDADARPHLATFGTEPAPLWADCLEQLSATLIPRNAVYRAWTLEDRACGLLLIGLPAVATTQLTRFLAFDILSLQFVGLWNGIPADVLGMVQTDTGDPRWAHTVGGTTYIHGGPGGGPWDDLFVEGAQAIPHALELPALGRDLTETLEVDTIEVGLSAALASRLTITGETSNGAMPMLEVPIPGGGGARIGQFVLGQDRLGAVSRDRRAMVGQIGSGRWVRPIIRHSIRGEPISITDVRVVAFKTGADPDVA
ncbi:MAG TPA: hypothetical protein DGD08_08475 [Gemmatimonas aurantiaca]|nr:hypothetical protein [Gemmatimonas aurantiaca]